MRNAVKGESGSESGARSDKGTLRPTRPPLLVDEQIDGWDATKADEHGSRRTQVGGKLLPRRSIFGIDHHCDLAASTRSRL